MLDQFVWGDVSRISPEAPVPIVRVRRQEVRPGGAGNVVSNVVALGGRADACGLVGRDPAGRVLAELARLRARHRFAYVIDPKRPNFPHYRGASLVKPNLSEASGAAGVDIEDRQSLAEAGRRLLEQWQADSILISRGDAGMTLFKPGARAQHFPTVAHEVFDVTGAGDTVLATCALALAVGGSFEEAAILANHAAGVVVGKD